MCEMGEIRFLTQRPVFFVIFASPDAPYKIVAARLRFFFFFFFFVYYVSAPGCMIQWCEQNFVKGKGAKRYRC